jgi:membrane protease YdiL (CAAX protease family)
MAPSNEATSADAVAPWWHTVLILAVLGAASVASWFQHGLPNAHIPGITVRLSGYLTVLVEEWVLALLVWLALRRRELTVGNLISGRWPTVGAFFRDLGLGVALVCVAIPVTGVLGHLLGGPESKTLAAITPKTIGELAVWVVLAASAGFSEELVFRGYLTRQFGAWTGYPLVGVFLQGAAFGLAHGFYGRAMVVVMVEGWLLGMMAYWRKDLRVVMLAHGLQDTLGGVLAFITMK